MRQRSGAVLVWFALLLPVLFGITGLVIDTGLMLATHRQLQNSADAAALAAAVAVIQDPSVDIQQIANEYVTTHYGFDSATVTAQFAETGMYAGTAGFVEVSAEYSAPTIFMHLLSGGAKQRRVSARAVAGGEEVEILDGIIALNPGAVPGVAVTGNAELNVTGRVIANSEGGGVDGDGAPIDNGSSGSSAFASGFGWMRAREVYLVGGANRSDRFENIEPGGPNPLRTGQLPVPDPMINLPTPTVENGVVNIRRGAPKATNGTLQLNNEMDQTGSANFIETDAQSGQETLVLHPGIYSQIDINGGNVRFEPGIYVVAAESGSQAIRITGGDVTARGVMFYNTTPDYDPITGGPDRLDGQQSPDPSSTEGGTIRLDAEVGFTGVDTLQHGYADASPGISQYNGMLLYQRRRNPATIQIQGFSDTNSFIGAVYAKWADVRMPAGGVFNTQLVVGSFRVPGHGSLTIDHPDNDIVKVEQVFLVE